VQFITFKNNEQGLRVLDLWRAACNDWCYDKHENGRFGDQQYLDDWQKRFDGVHELLHLGGGVAPWNVQQYTIRKNGNSLYGSVRQTGEEFPVIFYHFHRFVFYSERLLDLGNYPIEKDVQRLIYQPYLEQLQKIRHKISAGSEFSNPASLKNILRLLKRIVTIGHFNIRNIHTFRQV
jgi:hypothetical protein